MGNKIALLHWEDFEPGQTHELGSYEFKLNEMLEFAGRYDPQVFHIDEEGAKDHPFGGIIASGCLTFAIAQRLLVDALLSRAESQGSPGIDEMRFLLPVRPRDVVRGRLEVIETRESSRRPDRGTITIAYMLINQHDDVVLTMRARVMLKRREPGSRPIDIGL